MKKATMESERCVYRKKLVILVREREREIHRGRDEEIETQREINTGKLKFTKRNRDNV